MVKTGIKLKVLSQKISNLRTKLLKSVLNKTVFYDNKKIGHQVHKDNFKLAK